MTAINKKEIENILKQSAQKRYKYFLTKICDMELAWGLYDNGWALAADNEGSVSFALWPAKIYAELCAKDEWANYHAEEISLEQLLGELIDILAKEEIDFSIFMTPNQQGIICEPQRLKTDIKNYCNESFGDEL